MKLIMGCISKAFILSLLIIGQLNAQTASILPPAETTFFDANGNPLSSGTVTFSIPGTTTAKTTWQDAAETIPNANPVVLDAAGKALILGSGSYRQIVKDKFGNLIWDQVTASPGTSGGSQTSVGDGTSVGTILPWSGFVAPTNYQFSNGQAISRVTFSALLSNITQTELVTCVSGSPVLNTIQDTSQLPIGAAVEAPCVPAGSVIVSVTNNTVTINNSATIGTTVNAQFFPFGNGDGLSTFSVPDLRGRVIPGRNNMGGAAGPLTTTFYGTNPNAIGANGGSQNSTLNTANLPPYTPSGTIAVTNGGISLTGASFGGTGTAQFTSATGPLTVIGASPITLSQATTSAAFTGSPQGGSRTPLSIIQPSETLNYIIKVLPDTSLSLASIGQLSPGTPNELAGTDANGVWGNITVPTGLTVANGTLNFNIPSLPLDNSPDANNNFVPEFDAAGNITARVSLGQIAAAATAGVSSLNGLTGALTGVPTDTRSPYASAATMATTDCFKTVALGGSAFFTFTVGAASGYSSSCITIIVNEDNVCPSGGASTCRGKTLSINGHQSFILQPGQTIVLVNQNNVWQFNDPGRWKMPAGIAMVWNVNHATGSNTSDGLGTGSGAFATLQGCYDNLRQYVDFGATVGPSCVNVPETFTENGVSIILPIVGTSAVFFKCTVMSTCIWQVTASGGIQARDHSGAVVTGFKMTGLVSGGFCLMTAGQIGALDFGSIEFGANAGNNDLCVSSDGQLGYSGGPVIISGNMNDFAFIQGSGSNCVCNGLALQMPNALTFANFVEMGNVSSAQFTSPSCSGAGCGSASSGRKFAVSTNAVLDLNGAVLPGATAGATASGGQIQ